MHKKLVATAAVFLLVVPTLTCSVFKPNSSSKWHLTLEIDPSVSNRENLVPETVEILRNRLNGFGLTGASVEVSGKPETGRIRVNLPDVKDPERIKHFISSQGLLQLVHIVSEPSPTPFRNYATREEAQAALNGTDSKSARVLPYRAPANGNAVRWVIVDSPSIIEGKDLRSAIATPTRVGDEYEVTFSLKPAAAAKFGIWTAANINEYMGVVLNNEVQSIAFIKAQIFDRGIIEGHFKKETAEDLAQILTAGPLPAPVKLVEEGVN